jgi:tRNA A-37 threonylcarbamoyl transferase component Bud32
MIDLQFVGPSALPSPGESPAYQMSLLALTETSDKEVKIYKTEDAESIEKEIPNPLDPLDNSTAIKKKIRSPNEELNSSKFDDHTPTVVTHIETETSAAATKRRLGPHDFELMRVVGQGAFGKVFQVRKRDTQEIFAMKVMRKDRILERSHGEYVRAERDALTAVVHPYIVTLRYSFQTSQKLYLVLDFINGGHLFFQLYRAGTFSEQLAKLYTAELVLAVAYLHSQGFVHRDLKPENVLLDSEGHVKITDFGLAKGNLSDAEGQRTNSFIGTMEYMAPEIIAGKGHGKAVDWWSVGILLYEMLCGMPPFRSKSRPSLQKLILSAKVKFPSEFERLKLPVLWIYCECDASRCKIQPNETNQLQVI